MTKETPSPSSKKYTQWLNGSNFLKIALWAFTAIIALIFLLRIILAGPIGRQIIEYQIESRNVAGQSITVAELQGDILGKLKIGQISVKDTEGEWLNASQLELNWSPLALFHKTLDLSNLQAQHINVLRRPIILSNNKQASSNGKPFAIKRAVIGFANLQNISIHKETGLPNSSHSITLHADIGTQNSNLKLNSSSIGLNDKGMPIGLENEEVNIDLNWNPQTLLTGEVDVLIAQNGFIAHLLSQPLDADLALKFTGQGDNQNWKSSANLRYGNSTIASMSGVSKNANAQINLISDLENFPLTQELSNRLGTTFELDARADLSQLNNSSIDITFISRMLDFKTSGGADLLNTKMLDAWNITANVQSLPHLSGHSDLNAKSINFDGIWNYKSDELSLNGNLTAEELSYDNRSVETIESLLEVKHAEGITDFSIHSKIKHPSLKVDPFESLLGNFLSISAIGQANLGTQEISLRLLDFQSDNLNGSGTANLSLNGPISANLTTSIKSFGKLTSYLSGEVTLTSELQRSNSSVSVKSNIVNAKLVSPNPYISAALRPSTSLYSEATIERDGKIRFDANLESGRNTLTLNGSIEEDTLNASLLGSLPNYSAAQLDGENIQFTALANGPLDSIVINSKLSSSALKASDLNFDNIQIKSLAEISTNNIASTINYSGNANSFPFSGDTKFSLSDALKIDQLNIDWADLSLTADGKLSSTTEHEGTFQLQGNLAALGAEGNIQASGLISNNKINISASGSDLTFEQISLNQSNFTASGSLNDIKFDASTDGTVSLAGVDTPLSLHTEGVVKRENSEQLVNFAFNGQLDDEQFSSTSPVNMILRNGEVSANTELNILGGKIGFIGAKSSNAISTNIVIDAVSLNRITRLFGRDNLTGNISGHAQWSSKNDNATGTYSIDLANAGRENDSIAHINTNIAGEFLEGRLVSVLEAHNGSDLNIDAVFSFPLQIENGVPSLDTTNVARLDVGALGKLEAAWAIVGLDSVDLNGFFDLYAEAEAPLFELKPIGEIKVTNAGFEHERYGSRMKNIQAAATFDTESIHVNSAAADGVDGGHVTGTGQLYWSPEKESALYVKFDNFGAIKQTGLQANLTGDMNISRALGGVLIEGKLDVNEAHINIAQFENSGVKTIDVVFKDEITDPDNIPVRLSPTSKMALDLTINADRRMFVSGRGLDIELSGDMKINGTLKTPDVRGAANIVRGDFSLLGQPFEFSDGIIRIDGNPLEATTDLKADRTSDGVTSSINVSGALRSPSISFSSSPSLPEDEIISRLLFGRAPTQLSTFEAAQLALAAADMTSNGQGFTPLADIQNAFGLDRLTISQDSNSNPQLETGKYLAEDVYVELRSRANGSADLAVEWEAIDDVEIATVFGNEVGARVSVQWKKELD